jgi:hypothetical protein
MFVESQVRVAYAMFRPDHGRSHGVGRHFKVVLPYYKHAALRRGSGTPPAVFVKLGVRNKIVEVQHIPVYDGYGRHPRKQAL